MSMMLKAKDGRELAKFGLKTTMVKPFIMMTTLAGCFLTFVRLKDILSTILAIIAVIMLCTLISKLVMNWFAALERA